MSQNATMRSVRVRQFGEGFELVELPLPDRTAGSTLVAVEAAVVGHLDAAIASGGFRLQPELPYTPGVEGAGVVVQSDTIPIGRRVVLRGGGLGIARDGCWSTHVMAPDRALVPSPSGLDPLTAAAFFVPTVTAYVALHDVGGHKASEPVLVTGAAGAVGSAAVQMALLAGAEEVVAVVSRDESRALLPDGVTALVARGDDLAVHLTGRCPSLVIDTVGGPTLEAILRSVPAGGRVAAVGYTHGPQIAIDLPSFLLADVQLRPVNSMRFERRGRELLPQLSEWLVQEVLTIRTERFALDDIGTALDRLRSGHALGRIVVSP